MPFFLAGAAFPLARLRAVAAIRTASFLHIFCGQNCEEASCVSLSSLFLKGKIDLHKIVACALNDQLPGAAPVTTLAPLALCTQTVENNVRKRSVYYPSV